MEVVGRSRVVRMDNKLMIELNDEVLNKLKVKEGSKVTFFFDEDRMILKRVMLGHGSSGTGSGGQKSTGPLI